MDLSLQNYVTDFYQKATSSKDLSAVIAAADKKYTDVNAALAKAWSNDKAFDLAELLKTLDEGITRNKQAAALKEFFSLYAVTQSKNGSLGDTASAFVNATDKDAAAKALFEGIILKGYIGQKTVLAKVATSTSPAKPAQPHNEYVAINDILARLRVDFRPEVPHSDHFHITFQAPKIKEIVTPPKLLLSDSSGAITEGVTTGLASLYGNVGMVQVAQNAAKPTKYKAVLDSCHRKDKDGYPGPGSAVLPLTALEFYLHRTKQAVPESLSLADATVTVIKSPTFGKLIKNISKDSGRTDFDYVANDKNRLGRDRVEFEVSYKGNTYKIINRIDMVRAAELSDNPDEKYYSGSCDAVVRRIAYDSSSENDQGNLDSFAYTFGHISDMLAATNSMLDLSNVMLIFQDLPSTAVGETTGAGLSAQITLDTNAAGHGWYIDQTPLDNTDDYLPTSDPTVFKAKAGSAAEGKMDMLSVLLHEYGHALGLEHSANGADFMAASLQPGVRKLPSSEELALMSQLVAQLKAEQNPTTPQDPGAPLSLLGLLPLGLVRRNAAATAASTATHTDYLTAINPTLTNGSFATDSTGQVPQWERVGNVQAIPANNSTARSITLGESTSAQAHAGQAFVLTAQDRFLTFTVSGLSLQSNSTEQNGVFNTAPQDAFEVALQNANTGANQLANGAGAGTSNLGTSRSDALLNVQLASSNTDATLQERAVSGLRHTDNADGSRTYVLDLSGIAAGNGGSNAGVAVNLSFDLIGFGLSASQLGSKVNISDVRLISTPVAVADTATLAEDGSTTLTVQANDLNADVATGNSTGAVAFTPKLVASAQHGQVSLSAPAGVFSGFVYTPDANYFGTDGFT